MKRLLAFAIAVMMIVAMVPVSVSASVGAPVVEPNYFAFMFMKRLITEYAVELVYDETMGTVVIDDDDNSVRFGSDVLVTVAANEGYLVETVTVDGAAVELDEAGCYIIENLKKAALVEATFIADPDYVPAEEEVVEEEVVEDEEIVEDEVVADEEIVEDEVVADEEVAEDEVVADEETAEDEVVADEETTEEVVADEEVAEDVVADEKVEETVADAE